MSIQITAKEYNKLIRYGHLSTIITTDADTYLAVKKTLSSL